MTLLGVPCLQYLKMIETCSHVFRLIPVFLVNNNLMSDKQGRNVRLVV